MDFSFEAHYECTGNCWPVTKIIKSSWLSFSYDFIPMIALLVIHSLNLKTIKMNQTHETNPGSSIGGSEQYDSSEYKSTMVGLVGAEESDTSEDDQEVNFGELVEKGDFIHIDDEVVHLGAGAGVTTSSFFPEV